LAVALVEKVLLQAVKTAAPVAVATAQNLGELLVLELRVRDTLAV
jgi:hypothetical protein